MQRLNSFLDISMPAGKLFGIPIRLHFTLIFFILAAMPRSTAIPAYVGVEWVLGLILTILLHELGHALTAKHFRMGGLSIMIHGFGGFATSTGYRSPRQQLLIVLAGPAVDFVVGALLLGLVRVALPDPEYGTVAFYQAFVLSYLGWINILLGFLNLIPCLPWDGGQALQAIVSMRIGEFKAMRAVGHLSLVIGPALAIYGFLTSQPFFAIFGLVGVVTAYQILSNSGGIRFGEFFRDWKSRREMRQVKKNEQEKFEVFMGDVKRREKDREERERLRKMFEFEDND